MAESKRILILGGYGYTGKLLTKHLLAHSNAKLILGGRHLDKAHEFVEELYDMSWRDRISMVRVDASFTQSLRSALTAPDVVDLLVVAAPVTPYTETIARACLEARVDYLDVCYSTQKLAILQMLRPEIETAGVCFVTEAGFHPGLPSALVRYASAKIDTLQSAQTAGYLNMGKDLPYSDAVDELMEGFKDYNSKMFQHGSWTKPNQWKTRKFDFGPEIGQHLCSGMYMDELQPLPELIPSLRDAGFYMAGTNWFTDLFLTPIIMVGLKLFPQRGIKPLGKLLWWGWQQSPPPYACAIQLEATGLTKNGREVKLRTRLEHQDGYDLTAIPVAAYLLQYLDGSSSARKPGLHMMGHIADPVRLLKDMQPMGVRVVEDESMW